MRIRLASDSIVHLDDPWDFRHFSIVAERDAPDIAAASQALSGVAVLTDSGSAWVFEQALRDWIGLGADPAWQDGISAMIAKARPHGWYDERTQSIKAHVEWQAS